MPLNLFEDKANSLNDYFIQQSTLDNPNENTSDVQYTNSEITDNISVRKYNTLT